jgi:hypothetical protein
MKTILRSKTIHPGNRKLVVEYGVRYIQGNRDAYFTCTADRWEKNPKTNRFSNVGGGAVFASEIPSRYKLMHEIARLSNLSLYADGTMEEANLVYHWMEENVPYNQFGRRNEGYESGSDYLSHYLLPPDFHTYLAFHKEMYDNNIPKLEAERHDDLTKALTELMEQPPSEITPDTLRKHAKDLEHMAYLIGRIGEYVREKTWREIYNKGQELLTTAAFDEWRAYWKNRCEEAVKALENEPD